MRPFGLRTLLVLLVGVSLACSDGAEASELPADETITSESLPFELSGNLEGLLLVWYDEEGAHSASSRDEIPEGSRERVRVDSLSVPPEQRLDPAYVYIADVREAGADGKYQARRVRRNEVDSWLRPEPVPEPGPSPNLAGAEPSQAPGAGVPTTGDVIMYSASWCGACRSAGAFLRRRGVRFVEKDIERDSSARAAMEETLRRAGLRSQGIPVIDFRGTVVLGFDQPRLEQLIRRSQQAAGRPAGS